jgi:predicted nucleotide-binding protein
MQPPNWISVPVWSDRRGEAPESRQAGQQAAAANDHLVQEAKERLLSFVDDLLRLAEQAPPGPEIPMTSIPAPIGTRSAPDPVPQFPFRPYQRVQFRTYSVSGYGDAMRAAALTGQAEGQELERVGGAPGVLASIRRHLPDFDPAEATEPFGPAWLKLMPVLQRCGVQPIDESTTLTVIKAFLDSAEVSEQSQPKLEGAPVPDPKRVFVIYGQNIACYNELCKFIRSLGLNPKSFFDVSNELHGSPTVFEIIHHGMSQAAGVVALFTADEWAYLRPELAQAGATGERLSRWQARPNVIFEAGLAMGLGAHRTIFVCLGNVSLFSDVGGIHSIHLNNSTENRHLLRGRLKAAGCDPDMVSSDYLDPSKSGDFAHCLEDLVTNTPGDPFAKPSTTRRRAKQPKANPGTPSPPGNPQPSEESTERPALSEMEYNVLVEVGKQQQARQHVTARDVASALNMTEEQSKYYLDELSRKHRLLDWFGNMDRSKPDRYMLTHEGRRLLVERGVI